MDVMADKEVGELWEEIYITEPYFWILKSAKSIKVTKLIRTLVVCEARAEAMRRTLYGSDSTLTPLEQTLDNFGIDKETWRW